MGETEGEGSSFNQAKAKEEEQLGKKRAETQQSESEDKKRHKATAEGDHDSLYEDDDLSFYYEGDTEDERDDDFECSGPGRRVVEAVDWDVHAPIIPGEQTVEDRRCDKVRLCHKDQHVADFQGSPVFEFFKVRMKINERVCKAPLSGKLYGEIVSCPNVLGVPDDCNPFPITYLSLSRDTAQEINLGGPDNDDFALLHLSGPTPRPAFWEENHLFFKFAFKLDDKEIFNRYHSHHNPDLFDGDGWCRADLFSMNPVIPRDRRANGPFVTRQQVGTCLDPIIMGAYYTFYYGSWATVTVKLLAKDFPSFPSFGGMIIARPCVLISRIRLLTIEGDQNPQVDEDSGEIKLTRKVVAVPYYASLIVGAELYGDDGWLFCRGRTFFPAKYSGGETKIISYEGVRTLEVSVEWKCIGPRV